jgi:hypothetical protein
VNRSGAKPSCPTHSKEPNTMTKLPSSALRGNRSALPLIELIERRRWDTAPPAAKMVRRRCRIDSAATAIAIAELAGFRIGDDR